MNGNVFPADVEQVLTVHRCWPLLPIGLQSKF
jgi:hypothetical protein